VVVQSANSNHNFNNDQSNDFDMSGVEKVSDSDQPPCMLTLHTYSVILLLVPVSISLEELIKSVKSLKSKFTQQESKISKKLDETLQ